MLFRLKAPPQALNTQFSYFHTPCLSCVPCPQGREGMGTPDFCTSQDAHQPVSARPPSSFPSNLWPGYGPTDASLQRLTATVITPFQGQLFILCIYPGSYQSGPPSRTAGHLLAMPQLIGTEQGPESNRGNSGFSSPFICWRHFSRI